MTNDFGNTASLELNTIKKVKNRLVPFLTMLYFFAMLDRVNVGYAALTMNKELGITSAEYGLVAGIFFYRVFSV